MATSRKEERRKLEVEREGRRVEKSRVWSRRMVAEG